MNVVLVGSGGRENAIAYKISESVLLQNLFILPGNPGTAKYGKNINITNYDEIVEFCLNNKIDLVIVGPEIPLVDGLANKLREKGIRVFGPDKEAAIIEGDKSFSKELMKKYKIPTADYEIFSKENYEQAIKYIEQSSYPLVIKASGLAAGKGVIICNNIDEAKKSLNEIFNDSIFGKSGDVVVIEEFMEGEEASIFALTDGDNYVVLPSAQDHKRIYDNDKGKNTGGMGAYSPAPIVTTELQKIVEETIIKPTIAAMKAENRKFVGCLYCGLMINNGIPKVVEFNCRFGDPETQVVLPLIEGDLLKLLYNCADGSIDFTEIKQSKKSALSVVLASGGYPDKYETGFEITGIEEIVDTDVILFHSGTKIQDDKLVTAGGRVLAITALGNENNLVECKNKCYNTIEKIKFTYMHYRTDIGDKGIRYKQ